MGKWLLFAIVGLAVTAMFAAPAASAQAPTRDSVVAQGFQPGVLSLDVDVRSGPSGANPTGPVNFHIGGGFGPTYSANVTCLAVTGNTAVIGFLGTRFFMGSADPVAGLIRLTDAGGPGSRQDVFEGPRPEDVLPPVTPLSDCSTFPPAGGDRFSVFEFPPDDIAVVDAQPRPARVRVARLTGAAERPGPGDPDGRGLAVITLDRAAGEVCFLLNWRNISTPTAAHIHVGNRHEAGPIVVGLFEGTPRHAGCVGAPRALISQINATPRKYYVNIHTTDFSAGAIRGQIRRLN
jgi:hypothetical protein